MSRYEHRIWFDRLMALREAYGQLGPDDTTIAVSIGEAIEFAAELLGDEATEAAADSGWG